MARNKLVQEYVLITSMNFPSGGAGATYLNLFCRGLKSNGCKISVLLLKGYAFGNFSHNESGKNITPEGIPYSYLGLKQRPVNQFLKLFDEFLSISRLIIFLASLISKRHSVSLLVFNSEIQYNLPIYLVTKALGIKVFKFVAEIIDKSEFNGTFLRQVKRYGHLFNFKYLNRTSDKLILFSYYLKDLYLQMGYKEENIFVQPNLTDFEYWKPAFTKIKYTLGYSGAPYQKDGLSDLFRALSLLHGKLFNISLLVIGDAAFGKSLIPDLRLECERLGISENVAFTGLVESSEVKQYLSECEILTITRPSTIQTQAGFPTKLGEYFASGRPILATDFGDMERYFKNGSEIVMAECGNPESIAEKLFWMLQNRSELETISKKGYEKAKKLLEYKSSVNKIHNFLILS